MNQISKEASTAIHVKAGFKGRVGFGRRPAVLVVDFTLGFTDPESPLGNDTMGDKIAATRKLADAARRKGYPVIFTQEGFQPNMKDASVWYDKLSSLVHLQEDSRYMDVDPRLAYDETIDGLILKKTYSAFYGTNLVSMLVAQRVDTILVTGCTTSGCIRQTVADACANGFRALFVEECIADRSPVSHENNVEDMDNKLGDKISFETALSHLQN